MYPVLYVPAGDVIPIMFSTYAGATGASITLTGLAVTDVEIYKDGSVTQRASDAGYTLLDTDGIDFDGTTGIHGFSVDTGDNTDASFYTVGAWFTVVVSAVTVDSQTVNFIAAMFRLMPAESSAGVPKVDPSHFGGTAGTFSAGRPEVNTSHAAGTAWNSGAIGAATLASDTIAAAKIATGAISAAKFAAGAIDAAAIANGAIDAATFAADVDAEILSYIVDDATRIDASSLNTAAVTTIPAILVDTAEIGAAGAGLTALATQASVNTIDDLIDTEIGALTTELAKVPKSDGTASWNATALAAIQGEANDALVAYDPPTKAELDAAVANVSVDEIQATALADLFNTDSGTTYGSAAAGSVVKEIADNAGGSALTTDAIAEAMFTFNATATYATADAGSVVKQIADNAGGSALTVEAIRAEMDSNSTQLAAIVADTNELQTDWANGGRLDLILDARSSQTSVDDLPTNAELATALGTADDAVLAAIAALNNLSSAQAQTAAAAALTAYDPPTRAEATSDANSILTAVGDVPTNAELATALATADDAVLAAIAALNNLSAAQVNAEVVDALATDTYAEPGQGAPAATASLSAKVNYLYKLMRNRVTQTASQLSVYADNGTTIDHKASVSDNGTTLDRGELGTGP